MRFLVRMRTGIGFDIEHSEDIFHLVDVGEEDLKLVSYVGILIKIPFFTVYVGNFYEEGEEQ